MNRTASILVSIGLFGCTVTGLSFEMPTLEGNTTLNQAQQRDGYATAFSLVRAKGCSDIDRVVIGGPNSLALWNGRPAGDGFPLTGQPISMALIATERWVLHGCGRMFPFLVNVSGDGEGGTFVDVQSDF